MDAPRGYTPILVIREPELICTDGQVPSGLALRHGLASCYSLGPRPQTRIGTDAKGPYSASANPDRREQPGQGFETAYGPKLVFPTCGAHHCLRSVYATTNLRHYSICARGRLWGASHRIAPHFSHRATEARQHESVGWLYMGSVKRRPPLDVAHGGDLVIPADSRGGRFA